MNILEMIFMVLAWWCIFGTIFFYIWVDTLRSTEGDISAFSWFTGMVLAGPIIWLASALS